MDHQADDRILVQTDMEVADIGWRSHKGGKDGTDINY